MSTHSPQLNIRPAWNQTAKLGTQIYQSVWPEDVCSSGRILAIKTSPLSLLCLCLHKGFLCVFYYDAYFPFMWRGALRDDTKNGCVAD